MTRWYRAYEGTVTDPKLAEAAMLAGCSRSVAIAAWHSILESAAASQSQGAFETTARRIAVMLGEPLDAMNALFGAFQELGMISEGAVSAWQRRQFESDSSTERSRKLRGRRRSDDATLQGRDATPPDTDTEKNTSSLRSDDAAPAAAVPDAPLAKPLSSRDRLWAEGVPVLVSLGTPEKSARGLIGRWLRDTKDDALAVLDAIQRARDHSVVDPVPWITRSLSQQQAKPNDRNRSGNILEAFDRLETKLAGRRDHEAVSAGYDDGALVDGRLPGIEGGFR